MKIAIIQTPRLNQVTMIRKSCQPMFQKIVLLLKIEILTNTIQKPLSRSPRNYSTTRLKGKTSSDRTKLNTRQRCAEIGRCSGSASSKTSVHLPTVIMNFTKRCIFLPITKLNLVFNSIPRHSAHMATDANFCILNTIYIVESQ